MLDSVVHPKLSSPSHSIGCMPVHRCEACSTLDVIDMIQIAKVYHITSEVGRRQSAVIMVYRDGKSNAMAFVAVYLFLAAGASARQCTPNAPISKLYVTPTNTRAVPERHHAALVDAQRKHLLSPSARALCTDGQTRRNMICKQVDLQAGKVTFP